MLFYIQPSPKQERERERQRDRQRDRQTDPVHAFVAKNFVVASVT